jgi:hypothetical protein
MLKKCRVQEAKCPVKNLVRQRCAEEFNYGVEGLSLGHTIGETRSTNIATLVYSFGGKPLRKVHRGRPKNR